MKLLILLVLLVGCSEKEPKKEVMYQSGVYICEELTSFHSLKNCVNMSDMSEVKRILNATNIIEIEIGK